MALYVQLPTIVKREVYMNVAFPGTTSIQLHFSDVQMVMGDKLIRAVTTAKTLAAQTFTPVWFEINGLTVHVRRHELNPDPMTRSLDMLKYAVEIIQAHQFKQKSVWI